MRRLVHSAAAFRQVQTSCGLFATAIGVAVIFGWLTHEPFLKSINPDWISMKFNTALGMVLSGALLISLAPEEEEEAPKSRGKFIFLASVLALLAAVSIAEHLSPGWNPGLDELFIQDDRPTGEGYIAGRMSFPTALCFFLYSAAILALQSPWRKKTQASVICAVSILLLSSSALVAYAYDVKSLAGFQSVTTMAMHSAVSFFFLAIGLLCARPRSELMLLLASRHAGGIAARRIGAAAFLLPLFLGWIGKIRPASPFLLSFPLTRDEWFLFLAAFNSAALLYLILRVSRKLGRMEESKLHAEDSLRLLADASRILSESLNSEEVLDRLAHRIAEENARWSVLILENEEGELRLRVAASGDVKQSSFSRILSRYPFQENPKSLINRVFRTGEPVLVQEISDSLLREVAVNEEHFRALRDLGMRSLAAAPIVLPAGRKVLGVATVVAEKNSDPLTAADLALIEEIGRRVGIAIENMRLYKKALRAVKVREEVLGVVSHDLKNPLTSVSMSGNLILRLMDSEEDRANSDKKIRASAERIVSASRSMERLIVDLLDLTRIEAGALKLQPRLVGSTQLLRDAIEPFIPMAQERRIQLSTDERAESFELECDPDRLLQALSNLISNAIKFTPPGGRIVLNSEIREDHALFSVSDTGKGIAPADLPRIFDRFWQAQRTSGKSLGLGLSIVRGILQAHGGRAWVSSRLGQGSTFFLYLPLRITPRLARAA